MSKTGLTLIAAVVAQATLGCGGESSRPIVQPVRVGAVAPHELDRARASVIGTMDELVRATRRLQELREVILAMGYTEEQLASAGIPDKSAEVVSQLEECITRMRLRTFDVVATAVKAEDQIR